MGQDAPPHGNFDIPLKFKVYPEYHEKDIFIYIYIFFLKADFKLDIFIRIYN